MTLFTPIVYPLQTYEVTYLATCDVKRTIYLHRLLSHVKGGKLFII